MSVEAQQVKKVPRIGLLSTGSPSSSKQEFEPFRQGLRDLGYIEGQNIAIEYRFSGGVAERLPNIAAELVQLKVDIIVVGGSPSTQATKNATKTIPIVMTNVTDPVGLGLVASLAHPGGNVTGLSNVGSDLGESSWNCSKKHPLRSPVWRFSGIRRAVATHSGWER